MAINYADECKVCSRMIPQSVVNSPDWDGETCSPDCRQELQDLSQGLRWDTPDGNYMGWPDDTPEDDHELYEQDPV